MTMAPQRRPEEPLPVSARERAIPFDPVAEMETAAILDGARVQQKASFRACRPRLRPDVARLPRSRRPSRAAKSP